MGLDGSSLNDFDRVTPIPPQPQPFPRHRVGSHAGDQCRERYDLAGCRSGAAAGNADGVALLEVLIDDFERGTLHRESIGRGEDQASLRVDPAAHRNPPTQRIVVDAERAHRIEVLGDPDHGRRIKVGAVGHDQGGLRSHARRHVAASEQQRIEEASGVRVP